MNNKMIRKDSIWEKIKTFLEKIFQIKNKQDFKKIQKLEETFEIESNKDQKREETRKNQTKAILLQKLLTKEISNSELTEKQTEEMIEYVTNDIQNIDKELLRIKKHILAMKEKLTKNQI